MDYWEYRKFEIMVDRDQYIARYENNTSMEGWETIMDYWASYGWELVSLAPTEYHENFYGYQVVRFLAVWKRRKAVQELT